VLAWDSEAGDERPPRAPIDTLIAPFLTLLARTTSNHTFDRVMSVVLEPLVQSLAPAGSPESPSKKRRRLLGTEMSFVADNACMSSLPTTTAAADADKPALHQALLKQVFSVASERDTRDSNRRRLYKFWKSNLEDDGDDQGAPRDVDGS
jgi:ribosomal RNA-processing protein 1